MTGPVQVVGREDELALIRAFATRDGFAALVLEGEAGIGKTTLWREATAAAAEGDARVLVARPALAEAGLAFSALGDLLAAVSDEVVRGLPPPQAAALEVALLRRPATDGAVDARTVSAAVLGALRALAETGSLVVAVDDAQWLDSASAAGLAYAFRRLGDEPVRLVASLRLERGQHDSPLIGALPPERAARIRVGPLSSGALHRVIRTHLGHALPRPVLLRVHELAGGNPFYALELARTLPLDAQADQRLPPSLEQLTRERLGRLPEPVRPLLEVAALVGDAEVELLKSLAPAPGSVGELLDEAVAAGVIDIECGRVRFTHPLLAEAATAMSPPNRRRQLHARLAALSDDPEQRARHLALATARRDNEIADAIEQGARAAEARGAPTTAGQLYRSAATLTPAGEQAQRSRRTIAAARAFNLSGLQALGMGLLESILEEVAEGVLRADVLTALAELDDDLEASERAAEEALRNAGDDDRCISAALSVRADVSFVRDGDVPGSLRYARSAVSAAIRAGDRPLLIRTKTRLAWFEMVAGLPGASLQPALELQRQERLPLGYSESPTFVLGMRHLYADRLDEARDALGREAVDLAAHGNDWDYGGALLHLLELECRAGRMAAAAGYGAELTLRQEQRGERFQGGLSLYAAALVDLYRGRVDEARAGLERAIALSLEIHDGIFGAMSQGTLGSLELVVGDPSAADALLRPLPPWLIARGWNEPSVWPWWPDAIEALVAVGETDLAGEYLEAYDQRARATGTPWVLATAARCDGLLHLATGDVDVGLRALEHALDVHRRSPYRYQTTRTLLHYGAALRRVKRRRDARAALSSALDLANEIGAPVLAERAEEELARVSGRAPGDGALTSTEQRIAALVAQGRTNKQVAAQLFLTARTVEGNLTRIYTKLGVRSRTELARRFSDLAD